MVANPRTAALYEGLLDPAGVTYTADNSTITYDASNYNLGYHNTLLASNAAAGLPGPAVALVSDSTVGLGTSGGWLLGRLESVESDLACTVTQRGIVGFPYTIGGGTVPIIGRGVQVDGAGKVISPAGGVRLATERGTVVHLDSTLGIAYVQL